MRKQRGMTFIEILLLLALLTCMLLILLPTVVTMRAKGRKTQCMSNLRQIGMALEIYSHSYEGSLPPWLNRRRDAFGHTTKWDNPELLYQAIRRGISDSGVAYCPNDQIAGRDQEQFGVNHRFFSYYFAMRPEEKGAHVTLEGLTMNGRMTVGSAEYVMVRDANMAFVNKLPGKPPRGCEHFGGVNAVYLDGHAKWIR
jgi:prepilin-type processing-associated H-X9-DG protein